MRLLEGHSTYMVADRLQAASWPGRFFVFDSFEGGLSDKVAADRTARGDTDPEKTHTQKLFFASNYEAVEALMRPFPFVSLNKGWIPTVFDGVAGPASPPLRPGPHRRRPLRSPTRDSLAFFGPRMSDGGLIVIDDTAPPISQAARRPFKRSTGPEEAEILPGKPPNRRGDDGLIPRGSSARLDGVRRLY